MKLHVKRAETRTRPTAVGAYVFAGGFTLGVERHFDVRAHLEDGNFGAATVRANWPNLPLHSGGPKTWPTGAFRGVDFVYSNPPCSPWSGSKVRTKFKDQHWSEHPKAGCVAASFDLLEKIRPRVWTFESVRQVWTKARGMLDDMAATAAKLGYSTTHVFVAGPEHGIPQHRKRYFMVCHDVEIPWNPPQEGDDPTVFDALAASSRKNDAEVKMPDYLHQLAPVMRQGESARSAWKRVQSEPARGLANQEIRKPAFLYDRLRGDGPSFTIIGTCNKIHPTKHRLITANEARALCKFPNSFEIVGSANSRFAQIGRGVMPPVAEWLAGCVAAGVRDSRKIKQPSTRAIEVRRGLVQEWNR